MKSTFSRTLSAVAVALLAALLLIGIFFQLLVRDYLAERRKNLCARMEKCWCV